MNRVFKLPCGCTYDDRSWISECATHRTEHVAIHERAAADHERPLSEIVGSITAAQRHGAA
jgi:hypothetical protein